MDRQEYNTVAAALADVPDPRRARGKRYAWSYLLTLISWAIVSGQKTCHGIAHWVALKAEELDSELGDAANRVPSESTLLRAVRHVDVAVLEDRLARVVGPKEPASEASRLMGQAMDGKAIRGAGRHGRTVNLMALVEHDSGMVNDQVEVDPRSNEITAAPRLLAGKSLAGTVITSDALLTQRELAQQILDQGGDYLMVAKENQPRLFTTIALHFLDAAPTMLVCHCAQTNKGHGRLERRVLEATPLPQGWVDWPGARQIMRRTCTRTDPRTGKSSHRITYAVTSLASDSAPPHQIERLWRGHWTIENRLHYVRDVTMGEDAGQARVGNTPRALAAFRNAALNLFRRHGWRNIADALRFYAASVPKALALIGALPARL